MTPRSLRVALLLLALAVAPAAVRADARVLDGELVPIAGSAGRFRLVGHDGTFAAPPGTPLDALDGKAVRVELSADGHVTRITERRIAITPVISGWETVQGQLVVRDAAAGTFGIAGEPGTWTAPAGLALAPYAGKWVEATVGADGRAERLTLLGDRPPTAPAAGTCAIGGATVASGSAICRGGVTERCDNGTWVRVGTPCQ
ncbi:MAG: hypothetical protein U0802_22215 [Candidatus Binatia bacterium]